MIVGDEPPAPFAVFGDSVEDLFVQVQPASIACEGLDDAQALADVMEATRNELAQMPLTSVAKWRVPQIMPHPNRFDEHLIQTQRSCDRATDLSDLQRMGHPGSIVVTDGRQEDLRLAR